MIRTVLESVDRKRSLVGLSAKLLTVKSQRRPSSTAGAKSQALLETAFKRPWNKHAVVKCLPRNPAAAPRTPRRASGPGAPLRGLAPALPGRSTVPTPPVPDIVGAADPLPSAACLVLSRPRHRGRRGSVVLHPLRLRWSRPRQRPPIAPAAAPPMRPDADRADEPPVALLASPSAADDATGAVPLSKTPANTRPTRSQPPVPAGRRCRRACGCRTTQTVVSGESRLVRRERRWRLVAGVGPRRPRPPP